MCYPYTQLFLGATVSKPDAEDSSYEAAIVLWAKDEDEDDTIKVLDVVSFGIKHLSEEVKNHWSEYCASQLLAVGLNRWQQLAAAGYWNSGYRASVKRNTQPHGSVRTHARPNKGTMSFTKLLIIDLITS